MPKLTSDQRTRLLDAILDTFSKAEFIVVLEDKCGIRLEWEIDLTEAPRYVFRETIKYVDRRERVIEVCEKLIKERERSRDFKTIVKAVIAELEDQAATGAVPADGDAGAGERPPPDDKPALPQGPFLDARVFIDRVLFRDAVDDLYDRPQGRRAIVVKGGPATGKTYSWWYVRHRARSRTDITIVHFDITEWGEIGCSPDDICREIAQFLRIDTAAMPSEVRTRAKPARRAISLKNWLVREIESRRIKTLIYIDGLESEWALDGTTEFAKGLLDAAARRPLEDVSVILLGFGGALSQYGRHEIFEEKLIQIDQLAIGRHFRVALKELGSDCDDDVSRQFADKVLNDMKPPFDHQGMLTISANFEEEFKKVLAAHRQG